MSFFKVIIPNYNSEEYIEDCINSILNQTFRDFDIVIVDDMSTDNSVNIIKNFNDLRIHLVENKEKRYNGGSRNVGIDYPIDSEYTLFIDNDDVFDSPDCFQALYDKCEGTKADCITLPYIYDNGTRHLIRLNRNTPEDLVHDNNVACWTKAIKSNLMVHFPENTLMEDVSQHIEQCDVLETCVSIDKPFVVWNRKNMNSCSTNPSEKRKSSEWRQLADVYDLVLKHQYCKDEREKRINEYLDLLLNGKHVWKELSR
jgi:glycosyltransferase involved in cell wall biosynthesis